MPRATVERTAERFDLRTCPGGYVELRSLSYDELLERRDGGSKYVIEQMGVRNADSNRMAVQIANKWANYYTFPRCIVSHNLEDADGNLLDFSKPESAFSNLDPKIGQEIEQLIDKLNQESEAPADFTMPSDLSSPTDTNSQLVSTEQN